MLSDQFRFLVCKPRWTLGWQDLQIRMYPVPAQPEPSTPGTWYLHHHYLEQNLATFFFPARGLEGKYARLFILWSLGHLLTSTIIAQFCCYRPKIVMVRGMDKSRHRLHVNRWVQLCSLQSQTGVQSQTAPLCHLLTPLLHKVTSALGLSSLKYHLTMNMNLEEQVRLSLSLSQRIWGYMQG